MSKKILFLTGTRADYGKMKPLMFSIEELEDMECHIFVTGMHTLNEFGDTKQEVYKDGFKNIHIYMNQIIEEPMDLVLANTINGFSRYIKELNPDLIVIHGDRVEALAGAISGALNNILVAHVEGGEISGTIDESIRHSISKLSHIHMVSNNSAKKRLIQLGENNDTIFTIGSPDIDYIKNGKVDFSFDDVKSRYNINFEDYGVLMYHPVTTEVEKLRENVKQLVDAVIESHENLIVINPNNDLGHKIIMEEYKRFDKKDNIRRFPSIRFEYFIEILKNSQYLIGNSSAGMHEAPVMKVPSINIGTRQNDRFKYKSIIDCKESKYEIIRAINDAKNMILDETCDYFGSGKSAEMFRNILQSSEIWEISKQKKFVDYRGE